MSDTDPRNDEMHLVNPSDIFKDPHLVNPSDIFKDSTILRKSPINGLDDSLNQMDFKNEETLLTDDALDLQVFM